MIDNYLMTTKFQQNIISKLSLQVASFQEGFKILAKASSLRELGKNFNHILRGSILVVDINLFYKKNRDSNWEEIYVYNKKSKDYVNDLVIADSFSLTAAKRKPYKVRIFLPLNDGSYFGFFLGHKLDKSPYSELDKIILQIFIQLLDNSYQAYINRKKEKQLIFSLNNRVVQLNSLIDTGIEISKLSNKKMLMELALERAASLTNASTGLLRIFANTKMLSKIEFPGGSNSEYILNSKYKIEREVEYKGLRYYVTLANKESRSGYVQFDETDEILLEAFARQVLNAMENEFLHKEALEKKSIEKELSVAGQIQKKLLPSKMPEISGYDISGINIPSKEVGGDYYQIIKLSDGRFAIVIADVAGKGVPASLLVSTLDACLEAYLEMQISLSEMAKKINSLIYKASPPDKFITFFIAVLTPKTGELDVINAGHNPVLLLRKSNKLEKIEAGGLAFGMFDMGLPFEGEKLKINSGDRLFLYTDGIPEAMNRKEEEYSDERMEKFFKSKRPKKSETFIKNIVNDIRKFTGNTPQSDDITALYLVRN